ncbi:MAG: MFS transporter [Alphaproteobacteria bacterium]|nr:MFS transporter [Alphaproteobacteria bacterium]
MSRNTIVPLVVACALFMEQMDGSIIATALPRIAQSLHTDPLHLNLAITSYMFSLAIFIPLSGWVADRFGARTVFTAAIVVFTLGSIACGLSQDLPQLVLARIFQGMGGAMMVPVGRLALLRTIPKAQLVDAMAWVTAPALIGPVLGPPIGGIIVTYASWPWIFFVNLPIGILGFIMARRYFKNVRGDAGEPLDLHGFFLVALALAGMVFAFETLGRQLVAPSIIAAFLGFGVICALFYVRHARRVAHPIIDLTLFKYPTYRASLTGGSIFRVAIGALPFLLPLMLQYGFGMSPAMSGFLTLASAAGAMLMKIAATPIIRAVGFRPIMIGNTIINGFFLGLIALFTPTTSMGVIFIVLLLGGFFRSLEFTALNTLAFAEIPERLLSRANTFYNMMQQLTLSLGVAVGAMLLNLVLRWHGSHDLRADYFWPAYVVIAVLCLVPLAAFVPLPRNAGHQVSGHRYKPEQPTHREPA